MDYSRDIDKLRHSCSHVMAQAVKELWPDTKVTIGPAIENGFYYDFDKTEPFTDLDLKKIEKRMKKIIARKPPFTHSTMKSEDAIRMFREMKEDYKVELIEDLGEEEISLYKTGDDFVDLCKGPHVGDAGQIKAFKLLSVAGSYWRGDEKKARLQRIYGTAFFSKEDLDTRLHQLEEAQKRDHRRLGPQLELFSFFPSEAGGGLVFFLPLGATLRNIVEDYVKKQNMSRGYQLVHTPHILKGKLWELSGHAEHYRENMYYFDVDDEEYAVKPMNCPGHMLIFQSKIRSYRDLPVRFFELGTVYRQEKAGVLHGLLRVRGFTQDDAHIFCRPEQLTGEIKDVIDFVIDIMADFGFKDLQIELSTRPEDSIGSDENWEHATTSLEKALKDKEIAYQINEGDGAFYGPKIDFKLKDALNREWQCGTVQCDFSLPERFNLSYVNEDGESKRPIMIHRAILGSLERFIGTIIEHYAGAFPLWLAPIQVGIIPISEAHQEFATRIKDILQNKGLRVIIDDRNESLNKRVREGTVRKYPYLLILGDKEQESQQVAVRRYGVGDQGSESVDAFAERLEREIQQKF